jgi:hypothetical protein
MEGHSAYSLHDIGVELRRRVLSLSQEEAGKLGIGKSTLHYLRRNAKREMTLTIYGKTREKLKVL